MTLTQLRTFVAVAAAGSIHEAADRLCVSQPAVSAAVASLQAEVGVGLVAREGRGLRVTPAGVVYARYARQILGLLDEAGAAAAGELHAERGKLRLAAVTTAGEHVLPKALASFRAQYPDAEIVLEVGNRSLVRDLLDHHEVDVVVGGRRPGGDGYSTLAVRPNLLVLVAPTQGGGIRTVTLDELTAAVWLLREVGSGTRATAEELLEELGASPSTLTVGSNGAIQECVQAGLGVSLMSRDAVARELDEGRLEEWRSDGLPLVRVWQVVARANEELPATAALFVAHLTAQGHGWDPVDPAVETVDSLPA
jgi:DNA-binding transcriptional LysR family regulator